MTDDQPQLNTVVPKECFVISPIGADKSDARKRSDQILRYVIEPVVSLRGYTTIRADKITAAGRIDSQLLEHVVTADLVIADLTGANPNVFYELAVRHALAKPFVQICQDGETLPFDIQGLRTIFFDHTDLDSVDSAKNQLGTFVDTVVTQDKVETPLSITVDLAALRTSSDPAQQVEAHVLDRLAGIERAVQRISRGRPSDSRSLEADYLVMQRLLDKLVATNAVLLDEGDLNSLVDDVTTPRHDAWAKALESKYLDAVRRQASYSDEPPF
jgi:hypothetical protein